ncbi:MAG: protein kinase [Synechococcaceae cyanobacterium]|nr:protein kinase [Synechococcaceae cyanobacterium]
MLPEGATLSFSSTATPIRVIRHLGSGSQGQVFEVDFSGDSMAMKWYLPGCLQRDPQLRRRLLACISATPPNESFLWPILVLEPDAESQQRFGIPANSFGYIMPLRPRRFHPAVAHTGGMIDIDFQPLLKACFHLVEAFHALHSKGLCYKDISLGNLFLDPLTGDILVCDNDNVDVNGSDLGGVLGTPGFMAPEVLLGRERPGTNSDLFSLAVLLFRLLTRHDPFLGAMELQIRCLDEPARRRLYGQDPVFIFAADDERNRPHPDTHSAALATWPIYPAHLQSLFQQSLGGGARDPALRVYTGQWLKALSRCLDQRRLCSSCGQEVFTEPGQPGHCWACGAELHPTIRLLTPSCAVHAQPGNELHEHHFNPLAGERIDDPIARIVTHPRNPEQLGMQNLSQQPWRVAVHAGDAITLPPGKSCSLANLKEVHTHRGVVSLTA